MTRQAVARFYAEWDTIYAENINGQRYWGSVDHHLPVGVNDATTIEYKPIIRFPINFAGMASVISAQVVVTSLWGTHFSLRGATPSFVMGRLSSPPPDHQNAATLCGGSGLANNTTSAYSPGWDSVTTWPSHNGGWTYGLDATAAVQAIWGGYPNYGFIFGAYNLANHRGEFGADNSGYTAYLDITYEVPNEAPTTPWIYSPGQASYGNDTAPLVALANSGDADGDPGGGAVLQYGVVDAYGQESWQTQIGTTGFDSNPAQYIGHFYPTLTRGKWHCFRGIFWDHHGAYSAWSSTLWHYVYAIPNAPSIVGGMQPIHNLSDLNQWSGAEARPTVRITPSDPDGQTQNRINIEISDDQVTADWSGTYDGSYASGTAYNFNIPYGLANDQDRYIRAQTRDASGNLGPWSSWVTIKVRWSQAIYQYHGGTASGQYAYYMGALSGGSDKQATAIFRSATDAGGVGAGPWVATIGEIGQPEWLNVLVRLAVGRDTSAPTALSSMSITFLGAAQQPDEWAFGGFDTDFWQLDTGRRRYGTKSLKWTRQTAVATGQTAVANTYFDGTPYVVPVVPNTEYTLSVWVQGTLSHGEMAGFVAREGGTLPVATTDPVTDTQGEWTRMRVTFTTDSSTDKVSIGVQYTATADGLGDIFWVDAVQIEEGPVASVWNPGQTGAVIVDVGGIAIDASAGASLRLRGGDGTLFDTVELAAKGLKFGDEWEVYSDGNQLLARADGKTTAVLAPAQQQVGAWVVHSGTQLSTINQWDTMSYNQTNYNNGCTVEADGIRVPTTGWYAINFTGYFENASEGYLRALRIHVNGVSFAEDHEASGGYGSGFWMRISTHIRLAANDKVTGLVYNSGRTMYFYYANLTVALVGGVQGPPGADGADGADGDTIVNNIDVGNRSIGARAHSTGVQAITTNVDSWVNFANARYDTDGFWSASLPTRLTIPANVPSGIYHISGEVMWGVAADTYALQTALYVNGVEVRGRNVDRAIGSWSNWRNVQADVWLNPGDYIQIWVWQGTGVSVDIGYAANTVLGNSLSATYLGSGSAAGTAVEGTEVSRSTAQTYTAGQTAAVTFDTEVKDDAGLWAVSPNPTRITAAVSGWYAYEGSGEFAPPTTAGRPMYLYAKKGGTVNLGQIESTAGLATYTTYLGCSGVVYLTAGEYVELIAMNNDTASKDLSAAKFRLVKMAAGADSTYAAPVIADAPGVAAYRTTALSMANANGYTLAWDAEKWDTHGFWSSGAPSRFTIPAGHAGRYRLTWRWGVTGEAAIAYRFLSYLKVNGSEPPHTRHDLTMRPGTGYSYNVVNASAELVLAAGDYVELFIYQANDSAATAALYVGNISEGTSFTMTRLATGPQGAQGDPGTVSATSGVTFPATQVPSTDPNTLDDYEEQSWTPRITAIGGGEATYTTQTGRYQKVGKWVTCSGSVVFRHGTLSGQLLVSGLPFTVDSGVWHAGSIGYYAGAQNFNVGDAPMFYAEPNQTYCPMVAFRSSSIVAITDGTVPTGSDVHLIFQIRYPASA